MAYVAFTEQQFHDLDDKLTEINTYRLVAVNDTVKGAMEQLLQQAGLSIPVVVKTPLTISVDGYWTQGNIRLCWMSNGTLEVAPLSFYVNGNTPFIYARGVASSMSGILGYSDEWGED